MGSIERKVKESVTKIGLQFENDKTVKQYAQVSQEFNDLVSKGIAKKRGNNLLSLSDEGASSKIQFNTQH